MNEYIILNKLTYEATDRIVPAKYLVPLKELIYWEPYYKGGTYVYLGGEFHKGTLHVKESPGEIEDLINGIAAPILERCLADSNNQKIDLIDQNISLKEANKKLISELKDTQEDLERLKIHSGWDLDWAVEEATKLLKEENAKLKDQLAHSNPANPCCRETFNKLNNYYGGMNINYFCDSKEELDERGQLESWRQSFKDKIKENK